VNQFQFYVHCVPKNDTDVTHYRFNPHQPISVICAFSVCHRHVSSPGECGCLCACGKAGGRHFEHLQLTGSAQSHPHSLKRHYFWVRVSLGSAETLVRRGGIINHRSIAYSLSNISAKNYQNRLMWVESIVCNISVVFWGTQCRSHS